MKTSNRRPGRPVGSGKDDARRLARMADLIIANPSLKPTAAAKQVISGGRDAETYAPAITRRLQRKWKASGTALLEAARQRQSSSSPSLNAWRKESPTGYSGLHEGQLTGAVAQMVRQVFGGTSISLVREMHKQAQAMRDLIDPPLLRQVREMQEQARAMREMIEPSALQQLRELKASLGSI